MKNKYIKLMIVTSAMALSLPVHAVNKCTINGKITFSDLPCPDGSNAETIKIEGEKKYQQKIESKHEQLDSKPPTGSIDACFSHYRDRLLDPKSAYVVSGSWNMVTQPNGEKYRELVVDARARNKMGGFIPLTLYCGVTKSGDLLEDKMKLYDAFFDLDLKPNP